jgi:hypothetical protein
MIGNMLILSFLCSVSKQTWGTGHFKVISFDNIKGKAISSCSKSGD